MTYYKESIREMRAKQVAGLAMDGQVKACLKELHENLSIGTLEAQLKVLPAFFDALRTATCNQVREAYVVGAEKLLNEAKAQKPDKASRQELLKLQKVLEQAAGVGNCLGKGVMMKYVADCTQTLEQWRRAEANSKVAEVLAALGKHDTFEAAQEVFLKHAEELSESVELQIVHRA